MKSLSKIFAALAIILSDAMCAAVAYNYSSLVWAGKYAGASAPPEVSLVLAIPFAIAIAVSAGLSVFFFKKSVSR